MQLTKADKLAVQEKNAEFLLDKGSKYYTEENYALAIEYYRLAAAMGSMQAVSNLGYCFMYGRSIPPNMDLALAYFQISAAAGVIDSLYKLGDIYEDGKSVEKDEELAVFYYQRAHDEIRSRYELCESDYPSLYFALGRAHMPGGLMSPNLAYAYHCLKSLKKDIRSQF